MYYLSDQRRATDPEGLVEDEQSGATRERGMPSQPHPTFRPQQLDRTAQQQQQPSPSPPRGGILERRSRHTSVASQTEYNATVALITSGAPEPHGPKVFFRVGYDERVLQFKLSCDCCFKVMFAAIDVKADFVWHGVVLDEHLCPADYNMLPGEQNTSTIMVVRSTHRSTTHAEDISMNDVARSLGFRLRLSEERNERLEVQLDQMESQLLSINKELEAVAERSSMKIEELQLRLHQMDQQRRESADEAAHHQREAESLRKQLAMHGRRPASDSQQRVGGHPSAVFGSGEGFASAATVGGGDSSMVDRLHPAANPATAFDATPLPLPRATAAADTAQRARTPTSAAGGYRGTGRSTATAAAAAPKSRLASHAARQDSSKQQDERSSRIQSLKADLTSWQRGGGGGGSRSTQHTPPPANRRAQMYQDTKTTAAAKEPTPVISPTVRGGGVHRPTASSATRQQLVAADRHSDGSPERKANTAGGVRAYSQEREVHGEARFMDPDEFHTDAAAAVGSPTADGESRMLLARSSSYRSMSSEALEGAASPEMSFSKKEGGGRRRESAPAAAAQQPPPKQKPSSATSDKPIAPTDTTVRVVLMDEATEKETALSPVMLKQGTEATVGAVLRALLTRDPSCVPPVPQCMLCLQPEGGQGNYRVLQATDAPTTAVSDRDTLFIAKMDQPEQDQRSSPAPSANAATRRPRSTNDDGDEVLVESSPELI